MQLKRTLYAAAVMATGALAADEVAPAPAIISLSPASASAYSSELVSYVNSLTSDPTFLSIGGVMATAIPPSALPRMLSDPAGFIEDMVATPPPWLQNLPSEAASYLSSVGEAQASMYSRYAGGDGADAPQTTAPQTTAPPAGGSNSGGSGSAGTGDAARPVVGFVTVAGAALAAMGLGIAML